MPATMANLVRLARDDNPPAKKLARKMLRGQYGEYSRSLLVQHLSRDRIR
jgi:hypothetical protein